MHYCCYLYTRQFPTDGVIKKAMEPYYEYNDHEERPVFTWDFSEAEAFAAGAIAEAEGKGASGDDA